MILMNVPACPLPVNDYFHILSRKLSEAEERARSYAARNAPHLRTPPVSTAAVLEAGTMTALRASIETLRQDISVHQHSLSPADDQRTAAQTYLTHYHFSLPDDEDMSASVKASMQRIRDGLVGALQAPDTTLLEQLDLGTLI